MEKYPYHLLGLLLMGCLAACSSDCIFGEDETKEVAVETLPYFESLTVYDQLELVLVADQTAPLVLKGESHLVDAISFEVKDSLLSLHSTASCQWRHPGARLQAFVNYVGLKKITQSGYGLLSAKDTVFFDQLNLQVLEGTGNVSLSVHGKRLNVVANSLSNISLDGQLDVLSVGFYYSDGQLLAKNLQADYVTLNHRGTNVMQVSPLTTLKAALHGSGDVECFTEPAEVVVEENSSGRLLFTQ